mgnify:CR=1 FL=1
MANFEAARIPVVYDRPARLTGLPALDSFRRGSSFSWGVYSLGSPPTGAGGLRIFRFKPSVDLSDLWKAYLSDGYIQRAVDLIVSMVYHSGVNWVADSPGLDSYLRTRFEISHSINGIGWDELVRQALFDFVLFGNAFLVRSTTSKMGVIYGRRVKSPATATWYIVPARCMFPVVNREGTALEGWLLRIKPLSDKGMYVERYFPADLVCHLTYRRPLDSAYGIPLLLGAVEDIRSLRQVEEEVLRMMHRFVNPKIHITMPDLTGGTSAIRPDMHQIVEAINQMSSDAVLVTMPGQEVRVIGAESLALRAEPYLEYFTKRSIAGLGLNEVSAGHRVPDPDADTLDLHLRMLVRSVQREFGNQLTDKVLNPLLEEADWERVSSVRVEFGEPDSRHVLRLFTVISNLYSLGVITLSEARRMMRLPEEFDEKDSYTWRVQLPRVLEPLKLQAELGLGRPVSTFSRGGGEPKKPRGRPPKDSPADLKRRDLEGGMDEVSS